MTQNASDVEIINQGFAAFRQDLNDVLEDITTLHSGTDAPSTTYANQWWYETDTDKLYIRNEDNDAWIEILTLDQANDHLATIGASITLDGTGNVSIDSGDFTVDTDTLHVDSTNDFVGIGTTTEVAHLTVRGEDSAAHFRGSDTESLDITCTDGGTVELNSNNGDLAFAVNTTEHLRLNNSGRLGLGTDSPDAELHIKSTGFTAAYIDGDNSTSETQIRFLNNTAARISQRSDEALYFETNAVTRMTLAGGSGEIGMGMSAASSVRLAVAADASFIMVGRESTGSTDKFRIEADGDVRNTNNSYGSISDQNLKQDIAASGSQWDDIKAVQVKNYRIIKEVADDENAPTYLGVIAQDLEASGMGGLVKESAKQLDDGTYSDTETEKSVKYSVLYMKAVKALQEAMTKIETLETKVATLETASADFETRLTALESN